MMMNKIINSIVYLLRCSFYIGLVFSMIINSSMVIYYLSGDIIFDVVVKNVLTLNLLWLLPFLILKSFNKSLLFNPHYP